MLVYYRTLNIVPVLYSRTLLFIHCVYNNLHLPAANYHFIPPPTPWVTTSLFSLSCPVSRVLFVCLFVFIYFYQLEANYFTILQWFLSYIDMNLPYDPAIPLLGIHTKETRSERDTCTPMFIVALFIIARTWKQPRCP